MAQAPVRRLGGVLLGTLLAILVAWSPLGVQPAFAAGSLRIQAATTYTVDPGDGRIHVALRYRVTNNKPNTTTIIYFYRTLNLGIQPDARSIVATDRAGRLAASTVRHENFTEVNVRLRSDLHYRRTTTFTLRYDLVGGKPRSASPIRVTQAFVTFGVWAFGDRSLGTVEVRVPAGFESTVEGDSMTSKVEGSTTVLRADPHDPNSFFSIITGERREAYDESRLSMPGGAEIVVLSWPEDDRWEETVSETLEAGFPELQELVGLDWPVAHDLSIRERYTPALEGYAGIFFTDDQRIDVSEDLDPVTIMHEASHAWFNEDLFAARWIYEGLAEEYAWRALDAAGLETAQLPDQPDVFDPGWQALIGWTFPEVIRDQETDHEERYGYDASFWILHLIVEAAGEEHMRQAFARAEANVTAYPGDGRPETVAAADDWRRFLDLVEPLDEPDPPAIEAAIRAYVTTTLEAQTLAIRTKARATYRQLVSAGDGWMPPWTVRSHMGAWRFAEANAAMSEATALLALRDGVEAAAAAEGLPITDDLETAYESATDGLAAATDLAQEQRAAIEAITQAHVKVATEPDVIARLGLLGEPSPGVPYEAARTAFAAGDLALALTSAQAAATMIERAPTIGQERIVMAGIVLLALVALLVFIVVVRRRRTRRALGIELGSAAFLALDDRLAPTAAADGDTSGARSESATASGTLGADPDAPSPSIGGTLPEAEGGKPP